MDSVSSAEASLSCMEAGETEKESARGCFLFFRLLLFLLGYPAGASAEEREGRIRVKKEAIFFPQIVSLLEGCYLIGNVILRKVLSHNWEASVLWACFEILDVFLKSGLRRISAVKCSPLTKPFLRVRAAD